jgi:hypothetical protein
VGSLPVPTPKRLNTPKPGCAEAFHHLPSTCRSCSERCGTVRLAAEGVAAAQQLRYRNAEFRRPSHPLFSNEERVVDVALPGEFKRSTGWAEAELHFASHDPCAGSDCLSSHLRGTTCRSRFQQRTRRIALVLAEAIVRCRVFSCAKAPHT